MQFFGVFCVCGGVFFYNSQLHLSKHPHFRYFGNTITKTKINYHGSLHDELLELTNDRSFL